LIYSSYIQVFVQNFLELAHGMINAVAEVSLGQSFHLSL